MGESADIAWTGETNRQLNVYRACPCEVCSKNRKGVGYLSFSDVNGRGFTIWIESEKIFRNLKRAIRHSRKDSPNNRRAVRTNCNEGLQNAAPPKPDRIELLKQVRRATIDDQLHLLGWLQNKYSKTRPPERK